VFFFSLWFSSSSFSALRHHHKQQLTNFLLGLLSASFLPYLARKIQKQRKKTEKIFGEHFLNPLDVLLVDGKQQKRIKADGDDQNMYFLDI
jgi:hypothetical protein